MLCYVMNGVSSVHPGRSDEMFMAGHHQDGLDFWFALFLDNDTSEDATAGANTSATGSADRVRHAISSEELARRLRQREEAQAFPPQSTLTCGCLSSPQATACLSSPQALHTLARSSTPHYSSALLPTSERPNNSRGLFFD